MTASERIERLTSQCDKLAGRVKTLESTNAELTRQRDVALSEAMRATELAERAEVALRVLDSQHRQLGALLREVLAAIPADVLERFAVGRSEVPSLPEVFGESRLLRGDELRRRILARLAR